MEPTATLMGVQAGVVRTNLCIEIEYPVELRGEERPPCTQKPPEMFFPPTYGMQYHKQIAEAKAVCRECPIAETCLKWALGKPELDGIWGATTPMERRRLRRFRVA